MKVLFHITKIQIAQMKTPERTCLYLYFYVFDLIMTDEKQFLQETHNKRPTKWNPDEVSSW